MVDYSHKAVDWLLHLLPGTLAAVLAELQPMWNKDWGRVLQQPEAFDLLHWQSMSGDCLQEEDTLNNARLHAQKAPNCYQHQAS